MKIHIAAAMCKGNVIYRRRYYIGGVIDEDKLNCITSRNNFCELVCRLF